MVPPAGFFVMLQKLKSMKLWATVAAVTLATYELHIGHLQPADWVRVLEVALSAWLASHTWAKSYAAKLAGNQWQK